MFKWLTRNDGGRGAKAARRVGSPRASVFTEFALIMPIVVLVCSALIEIVGFWDAQVMANHAAWTVGRIVMVRGSDGLEFSSDISKKSKTGIPSSDMPDAIKKVIDQINAGIAGANKLLNNRGNVATMFLMSTCGIGYYGASPGQTLSNLVQSLVDGCVKALVEGIPEAIKEAVSKISIPIGGGGSGIDGFIQNLVKGLVDKLVEIALKPVAESLAKAITEAVEKAIGKDGIKVDDLFKSRGSLARFSRQMFGSASRIVRAKTKMGKEVLVVEDMDSLTDSFLFAKRSYLGRLVYPQVVDKEAKSDGYFVTGVHGWPANDGGLAMVHVEVNWPYESGWLFPVVSGFGGAKSPTKAPVAVGHSMVFPQPDIQNEHLYSTGAKAFDPGSYTNNASVTALDDLAKEMKDYLKFVKYGMRYRMCADTLTLKDGVYRIVPAQYWKYAAEIKDLWPFDTGSRDSYPRGGDYGECWSRITDGKDQDTVARNLKVYFDPGSYRYRDYFYWDGACHKRYSQTLNTMVGNAGLGSWYDADSSRPLTYRDAGENLFNRGASAMKATTQAYIKHASEISAAFPSGGVNADWLYNKICDFASRNKVNVHNLVKWQEGHDLEAWKAQDKELQETAKKAERSFAAIKKLLQDEVKDIENMENGKSTWTGDDEDPVFDPNDEEVMKNPDAAAKKARAKWVTMKQNLRKKLAEVDDAAVALRNEWEAYQSAVSSFRSKRKAESVVSQFAEACVNTLVRRKDKTIFDSGNDSSFRIPSGCNPYDIGKGTRDMLSKAKSYYDKLDKSYNLEVEYGAMLGLASAGKAKRDGKHPEDVIPGGDGIPEDSPGSLAPGSDTGSIIDKDRQTYSGGQWKWN